MTKGDNSREISSCAGQGIFCDMTNSLVMVLCMRAFG